MVQSLMDAVDLDGSGCIDLSEFCASLMDASKLTRAEHLQHVFEKLDTDKDGFLSVSELMQVSLSGLRWWCGHTHARAAQRSGVVWHLSAAPRRQLAAKAKSRLRLQAGVSKADVVRFMKQADSDANGLVDYGEFTKALCATGTDFEAAAEADDSDKSGSDGRAKKRPKNANDATASARKASLADVPVDTRARPPSSGVLGILKGFFGSLLG